MIVLDASVAVELLTNGRLAGSIREFLGRLAALPAERYSHTPLLERIWELRHNFTACDATYIALAEAAGSILFTCDEKLRRGHRARVVLFNG